MKKLLDTSSLTNVGLNIFLTVKVSAIPIEIYQFDEIHKDKTLCLIGSGGKSLWENLPRPFDSKLHPIDEFCISQMKAFAINHLQNDHIDILFPNDAYLMPLQRLSRQLNFSSVTPMGIDICQEFGVWFSFRGLFLTHHEVETKSLEPIHSPCVDCHEQPCHTGRDFCPIKTEHQYSPSQKNYHASQILLIH
jgi:hypothetical protein